MPAYNPGMPPPGNVAHGLPVVQPPAPDFANIPTGTINPGGPPPGSKPSDPTIDDFEARMRALDGL